MTAAPLLVVENLARRYRLPRAHPLAPAPWVQALAGVSFSLQAGRSLGVVGESGSGKSTLARLVMALETPDAGQVRLDGEDLHRLPPAALRSARAKFQMVFQDPYGSLDPRRSVLQTVAEPLAVLQRATPAEQHERAAAALADVGLARSDLHKYPHEFSGGQRQRIGIARALALDPDLIICDEPVSALDVSVQAQILNLLKDLQAERGLTFLFISHNLAVVNYMADRIAVMANGRIVEIAPRHLLFTRPSHPYTKALLKSVPFADLDRKLDFKLAAPGGASDDSHWAPAFKRQPDGAALTHLPLGDGHFVLARPDADVREIA